MFAYSETDKVLQALGVFVSLSVLWYLAGEEWKKMKKERSDDDG